MSVSTYAELKSAIASWLHRSDLTSVLSDFVTLSESKFNRRLRTRFQETAFGPTTPTSYEIAIPSDFAAVRKLWRTSDRAHGRAHQGDQRHVSARQVLRASESDGAVKLREQISPGPLPANLHGWLLEMARQINNDTRDLLVDDSSKGLILKSPDGHYWRIKVTNAGALTTTDLGTDKP
jgi:hypothetical protein